jgi:hypothetical protein
MLGNRRSRRLRGRGSSPCGGPPGWKPADRRGPRAALREPACWPRWPAAGCVAKSGSRLPQSKLATDSGESGRSAVRRWCLVVRVIPVCVALSGLEFHLELHPGRCPGLVCFAPLGLKSWFNRSSLASWVLQSCVLIHHFRVHDLALGLFRFVGSRFGGGFDVRWGGGSGLGLLGGLGERGE